MSKKYRVSNRRGIPWVLLAVFSLAIYLWFTFDTGEYSVYIIVITAAVVLIWFARFFRKRHVAKQFDNYSDKLSVHFDERTAREDFSKEAKVFDEPKGKLCEFCGAFQSSSSSINCEHCGKELS